MSKRKRVFDIKTSPFITTQGGVRIHKETVEPLKGDLEVVKKKYYQVHDYTKIITHKDGGIDLSTYRKLSGLAKDLLYYIWHILEYNSPTFELKIVTIVTVFNVGRSYGYEAVAELIEAKYIARTDIRQVYWINHNRFFKGNHTFSLYAKPKNKK